MRFQSKHALSGTPEYRAWTAMMKRCYSPAYEHYGRYGGRGITVCERWRRDVRSFVADMGTKPTPQHSIERIDNDGNYELSNCRWATKVEQANNTAASRFIEFQGKRLTLSSWARETGISAETIAKRLNANWPVDVALSASRYGARSRRGGSPRAVQHLTFNGRTQTVSEWAAEMGLTNSALRARIWRGWSTQKALTGGVA